MSAGNYPRMRKKKEILPSPLFGSIRLSNSFRQLETSIDFTGPGHPRYDAIYCSNMERRFLKLLLEVIGFMQKSKCMYLATEHPRQVFPWHHWWGRSCCCFLSKDSLPRVSRNVKSIVDFNVVSRYSDVFWVQIGKPNLKRGIWIALKKAHQMRSHDLKALLACVLGRCVCQ